MGLKITKTWIKMEHVIAPFWYLLFCIQLGFSLFPINFAFIFIITNWLNSYIWISVSYDYLLNSSYGYFISEECKNLYQIRSESAVNYLVRKRYKEVGIEICIIWGERYIINYFLTWIISIQYSNNNKRSVNNVNLYVWRHKGFHICEI